MTLRNRLMLIFGLASLLVFAMGGVLVASQYLYAVSQLDQQLASYQKQASKVARYVDGGGVLPETGSSTQPAGSGSIDIAKVPVVPVAYIGRVAADSSLVNYSFADDTGQTPILTPAEIGVTPPSTASEPRFVTVESRGSVGLAGTMRVALFTQGQSILVIGTSLAPIVAGSTQLASNAALAWAVISLALGVAYLWVNRLGLRPIRRVTSVAKLINSGDRTQRVPSFPAQTEAAELGDAVNDLLDQNQRAEENLRRFVSDAAHELRTPLTAISGYSALYEKGKLGDSSAVADAMRRINEESTRMTRLVNDLLTLATLDQQQQVHAHAVDLVRLIDAVVEDMRVVDADRTYTRSGDPHATAVVDSDLATQLMVILLTNARDHSPVGTPVTVLVTQGSDGVSVTVSNLGPGIPPDQTERVFDRFARLDQSRRRLSGGGTGLGLAIARAIVERLGGSITIFSQPPVDSANPDDCTTSVVCRFSAAAG